MLQEADFFYVPVYAACMMEAVAGWADAPWWHTYRWVACTVGYACTTSFPKACSGTASSNGRSGVTTNSLRMSIPVIAVPLTSWIFCCFCCCFYVHAVAASLM